MTKNNDIDKYKYSGYGIGFDRHESFSFPDGGLGRNVIIFGVDMSSSTEIDNRKKDVLILAKGFRCILWGVGRDEAVNRLTDSVLEDKGVL